MRLPQALAVDAGGKGLLEFDVPDDATLADLLAQVRTEHPALWRRVCDETGAVRRFVNVYVGDDECRTRQGLATPLRPGITVFIIGSVAGG